MKTSLKDWRTKRNLTQTELAEKAGISIRTIQRIEKNISAGSPHILKSLSRALDIAPSDLEVIQQDAENSLEVGDENLGKIDELENVNSKYLKLINLSPLFILCIPVLNVLVPALFYLRLKKDLSPAKDALRIISFQIFWVLGTIAAILIIPAIIQTLFGMREYAGQSLNLWLFMFCLIMNLAVIFNTSKRINASESVLPFVPNIL